MTNKEAIDIFQEYIKTISSYEDNDDMLDALDLAIKALEARPQGEWILSDFTGLYYCSVCGNDSICHLLNEPEPNFCSFCGADMRGGRE